MCKSTHVQTVFATVVLQVMVAGGDKNFELLFESNTETFENFPIVADSPLPFWLKGHYVSNSLKTFNIKCYQLNFKIAFTFQCKCELLYFCSTCTLYFL